MSDPKPRKAPAKKTAKKTAKKAPSRKTPEPAPGPVSVAEVARSGDHRATLEAIRDRLAIDLDAAGPNVSPQIAARLQAVIGELQALPVAAEQSASDDLAAKRAARRATAAAGGRAARRSQ